MIRLMPILLILLYAAAMWFFSMWRMKAELNAKSAPLTHPRLMIRACARFVASDDPARGDLRAHWLKGHPKAALYVDFPDFAFVRLHPSSALLNAGFARAFRLGPKDLG